MQIKTDIIPSKQHYVGVAETLDYRAICVFVATGFFLDQDTFYKEQKVLKPGCNYTLDTNRRTILKEDAYFKWHYSPKERPFKQVVSEFGDLFEYIIAEQASNRKVILPLSGGLDSRTQAVALHRLGLQVNSFSYRFSGGHDETWYAKQIAKKCNFLFQPFIIEQGYLWDVIESLADINQCYSEFTHPRQMAFRDDYEAMGDVFSLGHWGDVLFDDMNVPEELPIDEQVEVILKKILKKAGLALAECLWQSWGLPGDFIDYLKQRIYRLLIAIDIPNSANAQIRAFKSLYWAPRWTSINLSVFDSVKPISMPYFDNRMCEFICSVPERFLSGRQLQIAYIKDRMPELAKLTWQDQRPFNLYSYKLNKSPWNLPYRIKNKLERIQSPKLYVQRNWELQFLGESNEKQLKEWLFENPSYNSLVSKEITMKFYNIFCSKDAVQYSHAVSMLLTLAVFSKKYL